MKRLKKRTIRERVKTAADIAIIKEDMASILKHCIDELCNKASTLVQSMNPFDNSEEEINSEAYQVAYDSLYEEPVVDNVAKQSKTTIDDVVLYALSHFGDKLVESLEKLYNRNNGLAVASMTKRFIRKADMQAMQIFNELDSKTEEFEKVLKQLPTNTPENRHVRMEMIKSVHEIYNSLDNIKMLLNDIEHTANTHKTIKQADLLEEFMKYHEDSENYREHPLKFDQMYKILQQYGDEDEYVDDVFKRAPIEDQRKMVELIKPVE